MRNILKTVVLTVLIIAAAITLPAHNGDRPQSPDEVSDATANSSFINSIIKQVHENQDDVSTDSLSDAARDIFVRIDAMPLDMLTRSMRLDMLDYYDAGRSHLQRNTNDGLSRLDTVSDNYLSVTISDVSRYAIRILKTKNNTPIVMTLYTVGGDEQSADTDISFYNIQLQELPRNKFWKQPDLNDYLNLKNVSKQTRLNIENAIPFPTFVFDASSPDNIVTGKLTIKNYLSDETYKMVEKYIIPEVSYMWNSAKGKFTVVKSN